MGLDINTPQGQKALEDEQLVAMFVELKGMRYIQTPKDKPACVDAILVKNGELLAVVETKCRYNLSLGVLKNAFSNEWLVTEAKIQKGLDIANMLCVKFLGFLYLVDEDTLLTIDFSKVKRRVAITETQGSFNGGRVMRKNAYICMDDAKIHYNISDYGKIHKEIENG